MHSQIILQLLYVLHDPMDIYSKYSIYIKKFDIWFISKSSGSKIKLRIKHADHGKSSTVAHTNNPQ